MPKIWGQNEEKPASTSQKPISLLALPKPNTQHPTGFRVPNLTLAMDIWANRQLIKRKELL